MNISCFEHVAFRLNPHFVGFSCALSSVSAASAAVMFYESQSDTTDCDIYYSDNGHSSHGPLTHLALNFVPENQLKIINCFDMQYL